MNRNQNNRGTAYLRGHKEQPVDERSPQTVIKTYLEGGKLVKVLKSFPEKISYRTQPVGCYE